MNLLSTPTMSRLRSFIEAMRMAMPFRSSQQPSYPKQGWSVKQGQRMARKSRNQAKNRKAHRG